MYYYRLLGDVHVPERWYLGTITAGDGTEPHLLNAERQSGRSLLTAKISQAGKTLDFTETSFHVPVAIDRLARAVQNVAGSDIQLLPLKVGGLDGFAVVHAVVQVSCLDEALSEFTKWTPSDHRSDLAGGYRSVTRLVLDPQRVPVGAQVFRVAGWKVALIVSDAVKAAMQDAGCVGAKFVQV